jgi:hypothetical protein
MHVTYTDASRRLSADLPLLHLMPANIPLSSQRRASNIKSATSLSNVIHITRTKRTGTNGRRRNETLTLTAAQVRALEQDEAARERERRAGGVCFV